MLHWDGYTERMGRGIRWAIYWIVGRNMNETYKWLMKHVNGRTGTDNKKRNPVFKQEYEL
jgi:hypothetical protein